MKLIVIINEIFVDKNVSVVLVVKLTVDTIVVSTGADFPVITFIQKKNA